jgi:D-xylulose reductase
VIVSDIHEPKFDLARKLGPVLPVDVRSQKLADVVRRESDGWGADLIFECSVGVGRG